MEEETAAVMESDTESSTSRIYEIGYHIAPTVKEEDLEKIVNSIRGEIEKAGGDFIAEGAPSLTRLSYSIEGREAGKRVEYDRGYFGWIKFEAEVSVAHALEASLKQNEQIIRHIVFRTVREDTRAKMKAPTLREVKRTDTIKTARRTEDTTTGPVSEEDLEKALQDITAE